MPGTALCMLSQLLGPEPAGRPLSGFARSRIAGTKLRLLQPVVLGPHLCSQHTPVQLVSLCSCRACLCSPDLLHGLAEALRMHRGMADRLAALWHASAEVEAPLWQEPVQGLMRSPATPSLDPAALDLLLCNALKVLIS